MTIVKINLLALQQQFHECTPDFIRDVCQARCCRSSTDPTGIAVVVTPSEAIRLRELGALVDPETGRVAPVCRKCPFQSAETHLCQLHNQPEKPRGCVISPFTINAKNTLIVRNRYRLLPCFKAEGSKPVYKAHFQSLIEMFGEFNARILFDRAQEATQETIFLEMADDLASSLKYKNQASKSGTEISK
jgi:Fe-S-cluster containining protein